MQQQPISKPSTQGLSCVTLALWSALASLPAVAAEPGAEAMKEPTAQNPAPGDDTDDVEVVEVTARRYVESIDDVPIAVTALSETRLKDAGAQTLIDIERYVPNLTVSAARATNTTLTAYIRGVGQNDPLWGFEPGVGLYVDDVYLARPQAGVLDLLDIERVEVLRGPQGTLYGKNTLGGAIKYITRELPDVSSGHVEAVVGSYGQRDLKAGFSTPLIEDELFLGISAAKLSREGYGEVVAPSPQAGEDVSDKDLVALRLNLSWKPSDEFSLKFVADDLDDDSNIRGGHRLNASAATGLQPLTDPFDTRQDMDPERQEVKSSGEALTLNWEVADNWTVKSITAQREGEATGDLDFDATPRASMNVPSATDYEQFSQELQFTYSGDSLDFVSGLYYFDGEACGAFDVIFGLVPPVGLTQTTFGCVDTTSRSVFAQASYRLNEQWSLTLGGRYDEDEKDADVGVKQYLGSPGQVVRPLPGGEFSEQETFDEFSPRIGAEYRINEDALLYASYSQGFKSGGFNMRANPAQDPEASTPFQPETVDAIELGLKTTWFDDRVHAYFTVFQQDYDDRQVPVSVALPGGGFVSRVLNAASASLDGYEVEINGKLGEDFSVFLNYGHLDAEYDEFVQSILTGGVETDIADQARIINAPEDQYTIGLNYETVVGPGSLVLLTDYAWRDDTYFFETLTGTDQKAYGVWNASAVYYLDDSHWRIALYGRNLGDKEYRTAAYDFSTTPVADRLMTGYYGEPRTWSLSLTYSF